jgi:hypothetical protein
MDTKTMKTVFTVVDRGSGKSFWVRIGVGFVNQDGSWNLRLDAIPVNGVLQVREWEPFERRDDSRAPGPGEGPRIQRREGASATMPPRDGGADTRHPSFPGDSLA